jgi:hypothetical protein
MKYVHMQQLLITHSMLIKCCSFYIKKNENSCLRYSREAWMTSFSCDVKHPQYVQS